MSKQRQNPDLSPLLTDLYQLSMGYSYYLQGRHREQASFDVFYRKNPFNGFYAIYFGANDVKKYIESLKFLDNEIAHVVRSLGIQNKDFERYLKNDFHKDAAKLKIIHLPEGSVASPKVPLMRIEGPLFAGQLIETAVLALSGFPSLVATNASRIAATAQGRPIMEFGLRRAQGINGALTASKYAVLGGCMGSSNVLAGFRNDFQVRGTMAHSYICSFQAYKECPESLRNTSLYKIVQRIRSELAKIEDEIPEWKSALEHAEKNIKFERNKFNELSETELYAFLQYASDYPNTFLALIDTYDTIRSGAVNFLYVAFAVILEGRQPLGIRLDSGDLGPLARECRNIFRIFFDKVAPVVFKNIATDVQFSSRLLQESNTENFLNQVEAGHDFAKSFRIVASNDLHESSIKKLLEEDPDLQIDTFGVGTHLATCKSQPALGVVYKLTTINGAPCVKFSNDEIKQTYPGNKQAFRLYRQGKAIGDLLTDNHEEIPNGKIEVYQNTDFTSSELITFDEALDLYVDHIDEMLVGRIFNTTPQAMIKVIGSLTPPTGRARKNLLDAFVEKLKALQGSAQPLSPFDILKVKTEARKQVFGPTNILCSTKKDWPKYDYPVYLSVQLRNNVRKSRGLE